MCKDCIAETMLKYSDMIIYEEFKIFSIKMRHAIYFSLPHNKISKNDEEIYFGTGWIHYVCICFDIIRFFKYS
jgi:hypothetical protein